MRWLKKYPVIFEKVDTGVFTFNYIETVVKDSSVTSTRAGWHSVWKTPCLCEKSYDLGNHRCLENEFFSSPGPH